MAKYLLPSARADQQLEPHGQQLMDASQARAMMAYQQQMMQMQMQMQMQEQLMAQEMAMYQLQQMLQQQHNAQLQQQHHAAHLDANDIRKVMGSLRPGESFEVELYQGFEVRHTKQRMNGAQILVAIVLALIILGLAVSS